MKKNKTGSITRNSEGNELDKDSVCSKMEHTAENDKIVIYTDERGVTELRADIKKETVWASQDQIARLFEVERSVVTKHIRNVLEDKELDRDSVCAKFAHTAEDGKTYMVNSYNLDVVLAVGYRTNSSNAIKFRIWATKILREYVVRGYSLDNKALVRLPEKIEGLREAIELIESDENPGRLKGKITIKLTKNMEAKSDSQNS